MISEPCGWLASIVQYVYGVANLHLDIGHAPAWTVRIAKDFGSWSVERKQ
ncbi:hypothetical protein ACVI1K_007621 [Bradyrhizobium sp. USDA 4508]